MSFTQSMRASTSRACSSSLAVQSQCHVRLSVRAYATAAKAKPKTAASAGQQAMTLQEIDRQRANVEVIQRAAEAKQGRYGAQQPVHIDMNALLLPVVEPLTYKDFEKRWIWAGFGRDIKKEWDDLARTPGYFAKMTMFGRWGYWETGLFQSIPRGFWAFCYAMRARGMWMLQWYKQHSQTQETLEHCRDAGLMVQTPPAERPQIGWRETSRRFWAFGHEYRNWDPSMREFLDIYIAYHKGLAARDIKTINKTSIGKMRANGLKIAQSGAKMSWELVEEPALPKIRWARALLLPDQGSVKGRHIVQICCSIDSIQKLHVKGQKPRTTRVLDNMIYQLVTPEEPSGIVMRERVDLDSPKHALIGAELEQLEAKEAAYQREIADIQKKHEAEARLARLG